MRAHIIYYNYLNPEGEGMSIGGIQTYLYNLIPVLRRCGYEVTLPLTVMTTGSGATTVSTPPSM